jgi:hypothetical protein
MTLPARTAASGSGRKCQASAVSATPARRVAGAAIEGTGVAGQHQALSIPHHSRSRTPLMGNGNARRGV